MNEALLFFIERYDEMCNLAELGRESPSAVSKDHWDLFWTTYDLACREAAAVLSAAVTRGAAPISEVRWTFDSRNRPATIEKNWEANGRLFERSRRKHFGWMGVTIDKLRGGPMSAHFWFGYAESRPFRGPRLAERLRNVGVGSAFSIDRRSGWAPGTVVLASFPLATVQDSVDLPERVFTTCQRALVGNADLLLSL